MIVYIDQNKTGDVSLTLSREIVSWLAHPVADSLYGTAFLSEIDKCWWLWSTDNFRIHALRLGPANFLEQSDLQLSVTRLAWEMKFGKEQSIEITWPGTSSPDADGVVPVRVIEGRDKDGNHTRDIDLWPAIKTPPDASKFWKLEVEWDTDRTMFPSTKLCDALKGLDEQVVLGRPADGTDAIVVAPSPRKQSEVAWFVVVVAKQPALQLEDGDVD